MATYLLSQTAIPEFQLELWPGYTTSIRQHEQHILVCAEITHKVMRMESIYNIMTKIRREERDFQTKFMERVLGTTVLTAYNNKTYRIDDINFNKKASDTFETKNGAESFVDYYKRVRLKVCFGYSFAHLRNFIFSRFKAIQYWHSRSRSTAACFQGKSPWHSWRSRWADFIDTRTMSCHWHHRWNAQ